MFYFDEILRFQPLCPQEISDKACMLAAVAAAPNGFLTRENALMHITASSIIVNAARDKTLMAYHNIYQSWAWTGGHADGDGELLRVALREAREETGIQSLAPMNERAISLEILPVPPHVKRGKFVSAHLHFNLTYALWGDETEALHRKPDENANVGWLPVNALESFVSEKDMLKVYRKILDRML